MQIAAFDQLAIKHLSWFVREGWPVLEPGRDLDWNWHHDLICRKLEAVSRGEIRELVICIPPRSLKSKLVSVFWHAWRWLHAPWEQRLTFANSPDLASRDSRHTRDVIRSEWYKRLLKRKVWADHMRAIEEQHGQLDDTAGPAIWGFSEDQNEKANFENTERGHRICLSVGAKATGKGGDGIVVDDPVDAGETLLGTPAQISARMMEINLKYDGSWYSRMNDKRYGWRVIIMQRLHEIDLAGWRIKKGAECLVLPMEYEPDHPNVCPDDPRTEPGELLDPVRFPQEIVDEIKGDPDMARVWTSQYQQRPSPAEGSLFKRVYFRHYSADPQRMKVDECAISVDAAFKDKETSSWVVMQVWGKIGARFLLLDQVRARMDFVQTVNALLMLHHKWPLARTKLIEEKANGSAVISALKGKVPGVVPFPSEGSKEERKMAASSKYARAQVAALEFEAGNVELPSPEYAPWIGEYIEELATFPGGSNDDQVDATSQIIIRWTLRMTTDPLTRAKLQLSAFD